MPTGSPLMGFRWANQMESVKESPPRDCQMDWRSVIQMVSLLMGYQTGWRWDWHSGSRSETLTVYPRWVTHWGTLTDFLMEMLMGSWTVYLRSGYR